MNVGRGAAAASSHAEPLSELRVRDAVTQLERGEGQVNEHVEGEKIIQTAVLRSPRVTLGPTVRLERSAFSRPGGR